jgi:hypothetical protein
MLPAMKALHIHAGERARRHIAAHGLRPADVHMVPGAAGGPKGLILHHLDQHLFAHWLPLGGHTVHLVGASIGAWRMATAAMPDPGQALSRFAHAYIHQQFGTGPGLKKPSSTEVSAAFAQTLLDFFGADLGHILHHPRWRLHVLTAAGRQVLRRAGRRRTALGFGGLALGNALSRRAVGAFLARTVFSSPGEPLPLRFTDLPTRHTPLDEANFMPAMQASCSIPFVLDPVRDIPGTPRGNHWDGGLVDYHLHWPYASMPEGLVLYPHFQRQVIPGWLDKTLRWRHGATPALDNMVLLAPNPEWVRTLAGGKLPDRHDFLSLAHTERVAAWTEAVARSAQLADEWQDWLARGCPASELQAL